MILKSLDLQGFKTFPDKTTLQFEKGVTSVVGPNGSGKSNISDAMRWVMGEQALRVLRCAKMEDVVFSGTPQRKAQGYAEVTLNIDNTDRGLPFDNDNVAITRRYYRSGESEYLINKSMVRLKDINELFMDTGLGRDGYSIIGQGKIDSIVAAKSEDRREIFEEASGISRFRYRKEESERRLNKAEENLVRLRDILDELEDRVGPLKQQAEKAEKFIAYDAEKKKLEIGIWLETLNQSGKILRAQHERMELTFAQLNDTNEELERIAVRLDENTGEINACAARIDTEKNEAIRFDEEAVRIEGEISVLMNDISHHEQNIVRLQKQITDVADTKKNMDEEIERIEEKIWQSGAEIDNCRSRMDEHTRQLETYRGNADEMTADIEKNAVRLAEINASLSTERVTYSAEISSVNEIMNRAEAVRSSIDESKQQLHELKIEAETLSQTRDEAEHRITAGENAVKGYEMRLEARNRKLEQAKSEADRLLLDANEQTRRAKLLMDLERNLEGFAHSVKAVMKESRRGVLYGIHGPVASIIKTPAQYAVAVETALGASMQNIVVETEADAKSAIGFLKRNNAGRATFLPRMTIQGRKADVTQVSQMAGFIGLASELCACDERFTTIKESLLGRVCVAENLDRAAEIAKQTGYRLRVVSLDGQVVNAGGSLTGGAKAKNSGLLSRSSEIERISQHAAELHRQAEEAGEQLKQRRAEAAESEAALQTEKGRLVTSREDRIKVDSELLRVTRELQSREAQLAALEAEKENAGARILEIEKNARNAKDNLQALEQEIQKEEARAKELAEKRQGWLVRCDSVSDTIQEIRLNELSWMKDKESSERTLQELQEQKLDSEGVSVRLQKEVVELTATSKRLTEEIAEKSSASKEKRRLAEEKRAHAKAVQAERELLEKRMAELRTQERDLSLQRERLGQEHARLQERSENHQREYDGIIAKLWEEYELTRREAEEIGEPVEDLKQSRLKLSELKGKIKALGSVNVGAVVEYKEVSERYLFMKEQIADVEKSKADLMKLISELTKQMQEQFIERFALINKNFGSIFRELFGGGSAELTFSDESDVLSSGIDIKVQPPGKIVKHIESLSGGEKALVAISIYFAIMKVSPPPFCVLDEIEAALDDVNVTRFAQYLRKMSDRSQFIVITHRRGTMEGSDMLYGVTMQDEGVSKLLAMKTQAEAIELTEKVSAG